MNRIVGSGYREPIARAFEIIPVRFYPLLQADFFCGADPVFAGLHEYETNSEDGRSYRDTAHVVYGWHQRRPRSDQRTTVVLPESGYYASPQVIVHELGHVLHERVGFDWVLRPVTRYARRDRFEAFAEAFTSWLIPGYGKHPSAMACALFDSLNDRLTA